MILFFLGGRGIVKRHGNLSFFDNLLVLHNVFKPFLMTNYLILILLITLFLRLSITFLFLGQQMCKDNTKLLPYNIQKRLHWPKSPKVSHNLALFFSNVPFIVFIRGNWFGDPDTCPSNYTPDFNTAKCFETHSTA